MWNRNTFATSESAIFSTVQKPRLKPFLLTYVLNFNPTSISSHYFFQECFQFNGSIRHTMNRGLFELCRITATMLHMCISRGSRGSAATVISFLQLTSSLCEARNQWYIAHAAMVSTATEFIALDILFDKKCEQCLDPNQYFFMTNSILSVGRWYQLPS